MTKHKVIYVPLDERPCNLIFPCEIAAETPLEVVAPPKEILGDKKSPANFAELKNFLLENVSGAEICVISLDMLLYGGIIPSRLHQLDVKSLRNRLNTLAEMKAINAGLRIYAFALVMRCPSYSSADEEPDYYEFCGREIFLTGQIKHKIELGLADKSQAESLLKSYSEKTGEYLADYENRRKINRQMLCEAASLLGETINFLVIPQDDSAPFGYTSSDREFLKKAIGKKAEEIPVYPGADEVGMTLLARSACDVFGKTPDIYCVFPTAESQNVIPLYEDRPVKETLDSQLSVCGAKRSFDEKTFDIALYMNYSANSPVEVWQEKTEGYNQRNLAKFCDEISRSVAGGKIVAVADGAYANGGDAEFVKMLSEKIDLMSLSSYAGWNTSSNSLGTALAQAIFVWLFGKTESQNRFLAKRFFEDVGYCAFARKRITDDVLPTLGYNYFDVGEKDGKVAQTVKETLQNYAQKNLPQVYKKYSVEKCVLPWKRMFEVDLTLKKV